MEKRPLTEEERAELRRKAEKATSGPWINVRPADQDGGKSVAHAGPCTTERGSATPTSIRPVAGNDDWARFHAIDGEQAGRNAAFIAAADSSTVLSLLDERDDLVQDLAARDAKVTDLVLNAVARAKESYAATLRQVRDERDALAGEVARLRETVGMAREFSVASGVRLVPSGSGRWRFIADGAGAIDNVPFPVYREDYATPGEALTVLAAHRKANP